MSVGCLHQGVRHEACGSSVWSAESGFAICENVVCWGVKKNNSRRAYVWDAPLLSVAWVTSFAGRRKEDTGIAVARAAFAPTSKKRLKVAPGIGESFQRSVSA